jgi:hypothetical protein
MKASSEGLRGKSGPPTVGDRQILVHDRFAGAIAVEAGSLLSLELEQLQKRLL